MTTDPDLDQALQEIAARAPDPSALQSRLASRIRAHRQRRATLTAAAVLGVGAAAGIPAALAGRARVAPPTRPGPTPTLRNSTPTLAPLLLRPTWVPEGLIAFSRSVSVDDVDSRQEWLTAQDSEPRLLGVIPPRESPAVTIAVRRPWTEPSSPHYPLPGNPNTTVGGRPAVHSDGVLTWVIAEDRLATVEAQTSSSAEVRRIADSAVDDDRALCEVAMRAGWLPTLIYEGRELPMQQRISVWGTAQHWVQQVTYAGTIVINLAHLPSAADMPRVFDQHGLSQPFEEITLRGQPGRARYTRAGSGVEARFEVLFDLPDGRIAQVKCYFPDDPAQLRANTIRIAEELSIGPNPDLRWLGRPTP